MFGVHWARKDRPMYFLPMSTTIKAHCPSHLTTPGEKVAVHVCTCVFSRCCLTMFQWLLEDHRMRAWLLNHLKSCSAQLGQNCGQWAKAEHCRHCFSSWPPCNTHTSPPPNLLQPVFSPHSNKATPWNIHADRVSMIVSMQIRPNLHFKLQVVTLSSSMDIFILTLDVSLRKLLVSIAPHSISWQSSANCFFSLNPENLHNLWTPFPDNQSLSRFSWWHHLLTDGFTVTRTSFSRVSPKAMITQRFLSGGLALTPLILAQPVVVSNCECLRPPVFNTGWKGPEKI